MTELYSGPAEAIYFNYEGQVCLRERSQSITIEQLPNGTVTVLGFPGLPHPHAHRAEIRPDIGLPVAGRVTSWMHPRLPIFALE